MMNRVMRWIFLAVITALLSSFPSEKAVSATANAGYFNSCFAICAHESHGSAGWTGPLRTGANASDEAWADAKAHNQANAGHDASGSCN